MLWQDVRGQARKQKRGKSFVTVKHCMLISGRIYDRDNVIDQGREWGHQGEGVDHNGTMGHVVMDRRCLK